MIDAPVCVDRSEGGVVTVTINRPDARNAINRSVSEGVARALRDADSDAEVRVVVVTGAGGQAFSAGADLKAVARGEEITPADGEFASWGLAGTLRRIRKPVIAAVEGIAYGGGFEIALAADILVASHSARFALPEVKVGLMAGAGGAVRLLRQLPPKIAMQLLLTGEPIDAEAAHAYGLVTKLTPSGAALDEALRIGQTIASNAPIAVVATKQVALELVAGAAAAEQNAWRLNEELFRGVLASRDAVEGATAFAEKRRPVWTNS